MPYNTRRKSLSLPSLGIHVPVTHAARAAAAAAAAAQRIANGSHNPQTTSKSSSAPSSTSSRRPSPSSTAPSSPDMHPNKKLKRSHAPESPSRGAHAPSNSTSASPSSKHHHSMKLDSTPPPSPRADRASVEMDDAPSHSASIDLSAIKDEIVEAVVIQLQATANRPHLVKELATILMQQLKIVQHSANPCAIISSRLATYLKRPCWSAKSPCPLAKELETIHPRRTYFYLTTHPHQPLPDHTTAQFVPRTIITPPLSSTASTSEVTDEERRRELSPSPEVDLSSPEFDDMDDDIPMPTTPIGSFSGRLPKLGSSLRRNHRATSPPLEKDEKEFTQTAEGLQKRKLSGDMLSAEPVEHVMDFNFGPRDDSLFGAESKSLAPHSTPQQMALASPAIRPTFSLNIKRESESESWAKLDSMLEWDRSPENVELEELDGLLNGY